MKKRTLAAVASVLLAFVAVLGLGVRSALAATTYTAIGGSTSFVKNLVVDADANIPDITFAYTIQRGTASTGTTQEILISDVTATISNAVFSNADPGQIHKGLPTDADSTNPTSDKKYAQKTVNVTFPDESFTKPGVYRYIVTETNGNLPGVTYDPNQTRYLDVYVQADDQDKLYISSGGNGTESGYVLHEPDSTEKSSGYTNTLTQYDFAFSKTIAGNQGDKNKRFTFTLNITGANPGVYPVNTVDVTGDHSNIIVAGNGTATGEYELTDGSSITVLGLNSGAVCTVSEDDEDYTPAYTVDSGTSNQGNSSGQITMNANRSVAFTNTRNGVIPTGVILTVAPFAIGLMLFGALTVLFVSKSLRRSV